MFSLEITFQDGVSQSETIFVRRPQALIGGSDSAHVVIEDMAALPFQLRLVRDLGRTFRISRVANGTAAVDPSESLFTNQATLELGPVTLHLIALDSDLVVRDSEPPDRSGVRVLRQASSQWAPLFPAVMVVGSTPMVFSFDRGHPIMVGRAKQCLLRLDSSDVSAQHARIGYEQGEFWVEDLGSTNGTFVNQNQIAGRVQVAAGTPITVGREATLVGVTSEDQIKRHQMSFSAVQRIRPAVEESYPVIVSCSEVARPARLVLKPGVAVNIGRDPSSDMWIGAPHVSRMHLTVMLRDDGSGVLVTDRSTNGTAHEGGILRRGDTLSVDENPAVLDVGGNVTVAVCRTQAEEEQYLATNGSMMAFNGARTTPPPTVEGQVRERKPTGAFHNYEEMEREAAADAVPAPGLFTVISQTLQSMGPNVKLMMALSAALFVVGIVVLSLVLIPLFR